MITADGRDGRSPRTFAADVEASKTNLKAAPRASPKDAWASFAADERRA